MTQRTKWAEQLINMEHPCINNPKDFDWGGLDSKKQLLQQGDSMICSDKGAPELLQQAEKTVCIPQFP